MWRELRLRSEVEALHAHPIWRGEGVPDGRGRRVVLVPGFLAGARSMAALTPWLARSGWRPLRPDLGRNTMSSSESAARLESTVAEAAEADGAPVAMIGHSRGGQQARVVTVRRPGDVALLITLGAPHRLHHPHFAPLRLTAEVMLWLGRRGRLPYDPAEHDRYEADREAPFPPRVPFTSVYSPTDGFVDWRACLDPAAENVAVDACHFGLASCVGSFEVIAERLARLGPP